jgi:glyoxylase-like metal-dependent hydrolase (beta-lactamase superfamily II)
MAPGSYDRCISGSVTQHATRVSRFGFVNAFLVREDDGLTLIDTAIPGSQKAIIAAAGKLGMPIRRIVLTHAHADHVGSLDALVGELGDVEVMISTRDARLLKKDRTMDPGEPTDKLRGGFPGTDTEPTRLLAAGETVGSLEVVASPGHTPGHIALRDPREETIFCGDTFSTLGGVATSAKANPRFPLPAMATWHRPTVIESARQLRALEPRALAPGHGRIVEDPLAAMDAAIAKAS